MAAIPKIIIDQQRALIGVKTTNAKVSVSTPRPKMRLKNDLPKMEVEYKDPEFKLDWARVRAESGLMNPVDKTIEIAHETRQQVLEYTAEVAQEGNYIGKPELGGNRVAQVERQRSLKDGDTSINLGSMPKSMPNVEWDPASLNISWSNTNLQIEWDSEYMPTFSVEPHSVEIFLRNKPYIKITVSDEGMLKLTGRHVDKNV